MAPGVDGGHSRAADATYCHPGSPAIDQVGPSILSTEYHHVAPGKGSIQGSRALKREGCVHRQMEKPGETGPFYGSGDPTFIVGRHSVRFGDGLERTKPLHPGESRDGMRGGMTRWREPVPRTGQGQIQQRLRYSSSLGRSSSSGKRLTHMSAISPLLFPRVPQQQELTPLVVGHLVGAKRTSDLEGHTAKEG